MALTKISGDILKQPLNVGIITATSINVSGITTLGITSATSLVVSGISTLGITSTTNLTSQSLVVSGISTLGITSTTNLTSQSLVVSGISTLGITSATNLTSQSLVISGISTLGITSATNLTSQSLVVSGITTVAGTLFATGDTVLGSSLSTYGNHQLQVTGNVYVSANVGIGTPGSSEKLSIYENSDSTLRAKLWNNNNGSNARAELLFNVYGNTWGIGMGATTNNGGAFYINEDIGYNDAGISRFTVLKGGNVGIGTTNATSKLTVVGNVYISGISTLGITSTTNLTSQSLVVSGISTFTNGPILVGTATSTGTASQPLQVTGGAYVSGNLGVGVTNPTAYKVQVAGDIKSSQALHFGTDGTYEAGTIYSDANWGAIIRANTTSPVVADFLFTNSADVHRFRIDTSGNVIIPGNTTATGTASQPLQVTGGAYVSGNVGIGTNNPSAKLDVEDNSASGYIAEFRQKNTSNSAQILIDSPTNGESRPVSMDMSRAGVLQWSIGQAYLDTNQSFHIATSTLQSGNTGSKLCITPSGSVGIGTASPQYTLHVVGSFAATTKSFVITHPTKQNYKLQHGSLEGPENGVYIRGRTTENIIELPEYWTELVDKNSITVNLTPIGDNRVWIEEINNNKVYIDSNSDIDCFYTVFAERKDVEKLIVEIEEN